jgi:hypothetical protein
MPASSLLDSWLPVGQKARRAAFSPDTIRTLAQRFDGTVQQIF